MGLPIEEEEKNEAPLGIDTSRRRRRQEGKWGEGLSHLSPTTGMDSSLSGVRGGASAENGFA